MYFTGFGVMTLTYQTKHHKPCTLKKIRFEFCVVSTEKDAQTLKNTQAFTVKRLNKGGQVFFKINGETIHSP